MHIPLSAWKTAREIWPHFVGRTLQQLIEEAKLAPPDEFGYLERLEKLLQKYGDFEIHEPTLELGTAAIELYLRGFARFLEKPGEVV